MIPWFRPTFLGCCDCTTTNARVADKCQVTRDALQRPAGNSPPCHLASLLPGHLLNRYRNGVGLNSPYAYGKVYTVA